MARLLESDALDLFNQAGITVPKFEVVSNPDEARQAVRDLGGSAILKALIPVGKRGKAGAIRLVETAQDAFAEANELLGNEFLNFRVEQLLVSEVIDIAAEFFVSVTFDSMSRKPVVLFSTLGGIDVEEILEREPDRLVERAVDIGLGLQTFMARDIAGQAGLTGRTLLETAGVLVRLYHVFKEVDGQTVEINPLAVTSDGDVVAPSGLVVIDDQALFRHPELADMVDVSLTNGWRPLTRLEQRMREINAIDDSSSIRFNELGHGDIGFMVTGGGAGFLALDHVLRLGGKPATTFDITPGPVEEKMYLATKAILSKPGLKGLIVGGNISNFIPITVKVKGVMRALRELEVDPRKFPVVFRFAGPGTEESKGLAAEIPGIEYVDASGTLEDAVERIVERTAAP